MRVGKIVLIKTHSKEQFVGFFIEEGENVIVIKNSIEGDMVFINKDAAVEIVELKEKREIQPTRRATIKRYIGKREEVSKKLLKLANSLNQFSNVQINSIKSFLDGLEGE